MDYSVAFARRVQGLFFYYDGYELDTEAFVTPALKPSSGIASTRRPSFACGLLFT